MQTGGHTGGEDMWIGSMSGNRQHPRKWRLLGHPDSEITDATRISDKEIGENGYQRGGQAVYDQDGKESQDAFNPMRSIKMFSESKSTIEETASGEMEQEATGDIPDGYSYSMK